MFEMFFDFLFLDFGFMFEVIVCFFFYSICNKQRMFFLVVSFGDYSLDFSFSWFGVDQ